MTEIPNQCIRLLYFADGGINAYNLWDPFSEEQLRGFVDAFADNDIDILSQKIYAGGGTKPGLFVPEHPDFPWWRNDRFRNLIDSGVQPLEVMIEQAHRRGMKFFCKMRMSDWHKRTVEESGFVGQHPELQNPTTSKDRPSLDYTHQAVHDHHTALVDELARRFDIDGITFNFIRGWFNFPREVARERHHHMTAFIRQAREVLNTWCERKQKKIELSVIVPSPMTLCEALGNDVKTWIAEGLVDYVTPANGHYSDPNLDHQPLATLCRESGVTYCPALQSHVAVDDKANLLKPEQIRAVVKGMASAGADAVGVFNWQYYWARRGGSASYPGGVSGFPLALGYLRELRDTRVLECEPRHYWFRPIGMEWKTGDGMIEDAYRVTFRRAAGERGEYCFRLPEDLAESGGAQIFVHVIGLSAPTDEALEAAATSDLSTKAPGLAPMWEDEIQIEINGQSIPAANLRRVYHAEGRPETFGRPLPAYTSLWFDLESPPAVNGDNTLGVTLVTTSDGPADVVIEEVEVVVMPKPVGAP